MEVEKRKYVDFLLKMIKFHNIPVKTYLHKLSLHTIEKIKRELKNQGMTDVKRVSIEKREVNDRNQHIYNGLQHSQNTRKNKSGLYYG